MKISKNKTINIVCSLAVVLMLVSAVGVSAQQQAPPTYATRNVLFPQFDLPAPPTQSERNYLGLPEGETFKIGQIKAKAVLIEVMSVYCPYCQRVAPLLDEIYQKIEGSPDLKGKVKIIAIGQSNSAYELDLYKEKFKVPFPLFPDPKGDISKMFMTPGTPTFIGAKVDGNGTVQEFFFKPGAFNDASQFLADFVKAAGLR